MRVVIYTHAFPPMVGGIETITMELAQRLALIAGAGSDSAVQVTVVTPKTAAGADEGSLPFKIVRKPTFSQLANLIRCADILHVAGTDMLPLLLGWLFRKRTVVEHHGFQTACPNGQMNYEPTQMPCPGHYMAGHHMQCLKCNAAGGTIHTLKRWLLTSPRRWLCARAQANVLPTAWLGGVLQLPKMVTIHHGLPGGKIPASSRVSDPPSIVFLGRLVSTKGVHVLLEAVQKLRDCDFRLNILGDGPERGRLEADAKSLGIGDRVCFRGYLPANDVEQFLADARAVVMPSLGGEVFGLVALENMLRKKAMIVSDIGALTEVVGDTGLSFPAGDAVALANCLRRVLQSKEFSDEMGVKAFERASSLFTPELMVNEHLALYRRVLGRIPGTATALDSLVVAQSQDSPSY